MTSCPACSRPIRQGARFCDACGTQVLSTEHGPTVASPRNVARSGSEARFLPGTVLDRRYRIVAPLGAAAWARCTAPTTQARPAGRAQVPAARGRARSGAPRPVARRGARRPAGLAPERLPRLRRRRVGRPPLHRHGVRRRRGPRALCCAASAACPRTGAAGRARDLRRARGRARPGRAPPRPQAGQRDDRRPRTRARSRTSGSPRSPRRGDGDDVRSGTPAYMAPEQLDGREVTVQSDLYALGLVLYELFTGRHAFEAPRASSIARAASRAPRRRRSHIRRSTRSIERAILRCLEPDPAARPVVGARGRPRPARRRSARAALHDGRDAVAGDGGRGGRWRRALAFCRRGSGAFDRHGGLGSARPFGAARTALRSRRQALHCASRPRDRARALRWLRRSRRHRGRRDSAGTSDRGRTCAGHWRRGGGLLLVPSVALRDSAGDRRT